MDTSCSLKYVGIYMTLRDKFNSSAQKNLSFKTAMLKKYGQDIL